MSACIAKQALAKAEIVWERLFKQAGLFILKK
jgi:hypothetical protein